MRLFDGIGNDIEGCFYLGCIFAAERVALHFLWRSIKSRFLPALSDKELDEKREELIKEIRGLKALRDAMRTVSEERTYA